MIKVKLGLDWFDLSSCLHYRLPMIKFKLGLDWVDLSSCLHYRLHSFDTEISAGASLPL